MKEAIIKMCEFTLITDEYVDYTTNNMVKKVETFKKNDIHYAKYRCIYNNTQYTVLEANDGVELKYIIK